MKKLLPLIAVANVNASTLILDEFVNPNLTFFTDYSWVRAELTSVDELTMRAEFLFDLPPNLAVFDISFDYDNSIGINTIANAYWGDSEQNHTQPSIGLFATNVFINLNDGGAPYTEDTEATFEFNFNTPTTPQDFIDAISKDGREIKASVGGINQTSPHIDLYGHREILTAPAPPGDPESISVIPEPSVALMTMLGALGLFRRRR